MESDLVTICIFYKDANTLTLKQYQTNKLKKELIDDFGYFKGMFEGSYSETKDKIIKINLDDNLLCTEQHLTIIFNMESYSGELKYKSDKKIIIDDNITKTDIKYTLKVNYGFGIPIYEYYYLVRLGYFFQDIDMDVFVEHIQLYPKLLNDLCTHKIDLINPLQKNGNDDNSKRTIRKCDTKDHYKDAFVKTFKTYKYCDNDSEDSDSENERSECRIIDSPRLECDKSIPDVPTKDVADIINVINCLDESLLLTSSFDNHNIIANLTHIIHRKRSKYFVKEFYENIYYIYKSYTLLNLQNIFRDDILQSIKLLHQQNKSIDIPDLITPEVIQNIPLNDIYILDKMMNKDKKKYIALDPFVLENVIQYENITNFDTFIIPTSAIHYLKSPDTCNFNTYTILNNKYRNQYTNYQRTIKTKDDFMNKFKIETGNLFDNFDWTNVAIAGGFVYGLLTQSPNGIIESTDIDIYVYESLSTVAPKDNKSDDDDDDDDGNDTKKSATHKVLDNNDNKKPSTLQRVLEYFSKFGGYYLKRWNVYTIILPQYKYDIQIIPYDAMEALDIIKCFDWNYVQMYFNGNEIGLTFEALLALKYNIAIYNHSTPNSMKIERLYKTLRKGFDIMSDDRIQNKFIVDKTIDLDKLENYIQNKYKFDKSQIIRKLYNNNVLVGKQLTDIIKYYYHAKVVTTRIEQLEHINDQYADDEYAGLHIKKTFDPKTITRVDIKSERSTTFRKIDLYDNHNNRIYNLRIGLDYTPLISKVTDEADEICWIRLRLNNDIIDRISCLIDRIHKCIKLLPAKRTPNQDSGVSANYKTKPVTFKLLSHHKNYSELKSRINNLSGDACIKIQAYCVIYYHQLYASTYELHPCFYIDKFWSRDEYNFI